jgi:hypothetical protein
VSFESLDLDKVADGIVIAVNILDPKRNLTMEAFEPYDAGHSIRTILGEYARAHWPEAGER